MKREYLKILILCFIFSFSAAEAQFYFGAGVDAVLPQNKLKDMNSESIGANIMLESRAYCKLWYGLRIDYISFDKKDDTTAYFFEDAVLFSPQVRYNFLTENCYNDKITPYLQGMLTISSLGANDNESRFGIGAAAGLGLTMNFNFWRKCWMLDLSGLWTAPNSIYRSDGRWSIQAILLSLTLSMSI